MILTAVQDSFFEVGERVRLVQHNAMDEFAKVKYKLYNRVTEVWEYQLENDFGSSVEDGRWFAEGRLAPLA
jgi:hypothetical protein